MSVVTAAQTATLEELWYEHEHTSGSIDVRNGDAVIAWECVSNGREHPRRYTLDAIIAPDGRILDLAETPRR